MSVKISNLLTFADDKGKILLVCLSKLYGALKCSISNWLLCFLDNSYFYNKFILNLDGLSDEKFVSLTKNEYGCLV